MRVQVQGFFFFVDAGKKQLNHESKKSSDNRLIKNSLARKQFILHLQILYQKLHKSD